MSDSAETLEAKAAIGGVYVGRLAKTSTISTAVVGTQSVTLPLYPLLNKDYNIRVGSTAANVFLYPAAAGTGTTNTINTLANGEYMILAPGSVCKARCIDKASTGNSWEVVNSVSGAVIPTQAAALTLTAAHNGCTIYVDPTAARAITLPAVAVPGTYKFIKAGAGAFITTISSPTAGSVSGGVLNFAGAVPSQVAGAAAVNVRFTATSEAGSWIQVTSNGTAYTVQGCVLTAALAAAGVAFA